MFSILMGDYFILIGKDIMEEKLVEKVLEESEDFLKWIGEIVKVGGW